MRVDAGRDEPGADTAPGEPPVVELRHVAGLTAGQTLPLTTGRFRFGPLRSGHGGLVAGTPDLVSFDLDVRDDGGTVLTAGAERVAVEGVIVDRPVLLHDGDVVQLATDHFVIEANRRNDGHRPPDPIEARSIAPLPRPTMIGWLLPFAAITVLGVGSALLDVRLVGIALLGLAGVTGTLLARRRRDQRAKEAHAIAVDNARLLLLAEVTARRKAEAEDVRSHSYTPEAIARQAAARSVPSVVQLVATIASGDRPWEPPVELHRSPGWDHRSVVDELSFLPAIPYSIDLDHGPVAIIGPRAATLAVARHIITTAMCLAGPGTGAEVETAVPGDWSWLHRQPNSSVRVLDHVRAPVGPRTVVLETSVDHLVAAGFDPDDFTHIMEISDAGTAQITTTDGTGTGFVPHGITETHAGELQDLLTPPTPVGGTRSIEADSSSVAGLARNVADLTIVDADRLLVTGPNRSTHRNVLATAALRLADRHPDRALFVLDRGDRSLIRLAQLENCRRYATIDQIDAVERLVDELTDEPPGRPAGRTSLLLAPDLWTTVDFYRDAGHRTLADRLDALIVTMQIVPVAASTSIATPAATSWAQVWITTGFGETAEVRRPQGGGVLALGSLPGGDLTGAVARLTVLRSLRPPA